MSPQGTMSGTDLQGGGTLSFFQPAATGTTLQPAAPTGTTTATSEPTGTASVVDQTAAQRSSLKTGITNLISETLGIYDSLFGNLGTAAASQAKALGEKYARETGALNEQFAQEIPRIGQAYAGRGAYDSSWRIGAEQEAKKNLETQLAGVMETYKTAGQKLGQDVATQEAQFKGGQTSLNEMLARLPNITDINELNALEAEIRKIKTQLGTSAAGLQSQEAYMQRFEQLAPTTDRTAQLRQTLSTIIRGGAPTPLKQSVAAQVIGSSGLTPEEQQTLLNEVNAQLVPSTTTA